MLTSLNPGIYAEPASNLVGFLVLFFVGFVAVVALVSASNATCDKNSVVGAAFAIAAALALFAMLSIPFVQVGQQDAAEESALSAYQSDLREWLNADYDITVTEAEAESLTLDEQIAVDIDGDLTAIHLITGPAETIQVQIVGGSVLTPAE